MNILFADDHQLILDGLKSVIQNQFSESKIETAINKTELFDKLKRKKFDVLIQDIKFGDSNAKDFIDEIKINYPQLKILILSSVSDSISIKHLLKKVHGYVLKSESITEICNGIDAIYNGSQFLSIEVKRKINAISLSNEIILTRREKEVLEIIMQEKSTKEIADVLCISQKTVEMHRSNLFVKLNVKNITGLVKQVIALDLLGE